MDQHHKLTEKKQKKPSRLLRLIALCVAFSLPYILVNTFSGSGSDRDMVKPVSLPQPIPQRTEPSVQQAKNNEWQVIKTSDGDSLASIFKKLGLSSKTLHSVLDGNPHANTLTQLKPNQRLRFLIQKQNLIKLIVPLTTTQFLVVYWENGQYHSKINSKKMSSHSHYVTATVQNTLYGTAKKYNIPSKLIRQMTEIFNWEIDFSKDVRSGDQVTIIYKAYYMEDKLAGTGDILAVTYRRGSRSYKAIRHMKADGVVGYYTPEGYSLKKAFDRYPVKFSHISSNFSSSRNHPVLKYRRAHKGIDLAAPMGTPIHATSDGVIQMIGNSGGYGNMIKIKHNKSYSTVYAHLVRFKKGISKGSHVKKGEVIGYVGQTGLATGPHCHYEFHMNGHPQNPGTIKLPMASSVPSTELAQFKAGANTLLAHLNLFEEAYLASADRSQGYQTG